MRVGLSNQDLNLLLKYIFIANKLDLVGQLEKKFDNTTLLMIKEACKYLMKYRNPKSHMQVMNIDEISEIRTIVIGHLNHVIEKLY